MNSQRWMVETANRIAHYAFVLWGVFLVVWGVIRLYRWWTGARGHAPLGFGEHLWEGVFFVVAGLLVLYAAPRVHDQARSLSED